MAGGVEADDVKDFCLKRCPVILCVVKDVKEVGMILLSQEPLWVDVLVEAASEVFFCPRVDMVSGEQRDAYFLVFSCCCSQKNEKW